jgi:hypothetical protein
MHLALQNEVNLSRLFAFPANTERGSRLAFENRSGRDFCRFHDARHVNFQFRPSIKLKAGVFARYGPFFALSPLSASSFSPSASFSIRLDNTDFPKDGTICKRC